MKLAEAFQHCPKCGAESQTVGSDPLNCDQCGFTFYFSPITAVGAIVTDAEGRVLFIRRAKDPGKGKLGLPGGFVDAGESLEESLAREVLEESGLKATSMTYVTSAPNRYVYKGVELDVTDMFFHCEVESFDTLEAQEGEVDGFHQVVPTEKDLDEMAFESNRIALKMFLANRGA